MKRILTVLTTLCCVLALFADPIGREQATSLARKYVRGNIAPRLVNAPRRAAASATATPPLYVFSRGENQGFVIVAGDDCAPSIIGVVDKGEYDETKFPPALVYLLDEWSRYITNAQATGTNTPRGLRKSLGTYDIAPLIQTFWGQGDPYNRRCPYLDSGVVHSVTGCVATQGAMLAYYWRNECYDCVQEDTPLYNFGEMGEDSDMQIKAGTPYRWDLMHERYGYIGGVEYPFTAENGDAVAVLMATIGMTSKLYYGRETGGSLGDLNKALQSQLGLAGDFIYRSGYKDDDWYGMVIANLQNHQPIGYAGGGHAYILDGYSKFDDTFHFNFGWEGFQDGYFTLLPDDPVAAGGYKSNQHMLCNVLPLHPALDARVLDEEFVYGQENTFRVLVTSRSAARYNGLYVLLSAEAADAASATTTSLYDKSTAIAPGENVELTFRFTPDRYKPYHYAIYDKNGGLISTGTIKMTGPDPGEPTEFAPYVVKGENDLSDKHLYTLCLNTMAEKRGYLTASNYALTTGDTKVTDKQKFAIIRTSRGIYLYNQAASRFISPSSIAVNAKPQGYFAMLPALIDNRWVVVGPQTDKALQHNASKAVSVAALGDLDAGNQWLIEAVAEADAAKVAAAREAVEAYEASLPEVVKATSVTFVENPKTLAVGETAVLLPLITPFGASANAVEWATSNPEVATVEDGVVTAQGVGFAAVTATVNGIAGKCQVVVGEPFDTNPVSDLSQLSEEVVYDFSVNLRGYLSMGPSTMENGKRKRTASEQFAIVKGDKGYYIWNPTHNRFVPADGERSMPCPNGTYSIKAAKTEGRWIWENTANGNWLQHYEGGAFRIYAWHTQDDGNQWLITPSGTLSEESLAEAKHRIAAYESATPYMLVFAKSDVVIEVGSATSLAAEIQPLAARGATVTYKSSDETVVKVSENGLVSGIGEGVATITATCGTISATCRVSVKAPFVAYDVTSIDQIVDGDIYTFDLGDRGYLSYGDPNMSAGVIGVAYWEQEFAVVRTKKGIYIWNVEGRKFVPATGKAVQERPNGYFKMSAANEEGRWILTSSASGCWLQHGGACQFLVDDKWMTQDGGNRWKISAVGRMSDAVAAEARAIVEEYELTVGNVISAISSVKDGTAYLLYTDRGSMVTDEQHTVQGSCVQSDFRLDTEDPCQQWGILKRGEQYYLYNVASDEFFISDEEPLALNIVAQSGKFMLTDTADRVVNIGTGYADGIDINDWFTPDAGNLFTICKTPASYDTAAVRARLEQLVPVLAPTAVSDKQGVYDLQGRRLDRPAKGLYIINGKKVVVK